MKLTFGSIVNKDSNSRLSEYFFLLFQWFVSKTNHRDVSILISTALENEPSGIWKLNWFENFHKLIYTGVKKKNLYWEKN